MALPRASTRDRHGQCEIVAAGHLLQRWYVHLRMTVTDQQDALPRSVHLYPIPEDIIVIVPDYRGYDYIMLDDDRVAIVDPETYEVVDIIEIA